MVSPCNNQTATSFRTEVSKNLSAGSAEVPVDTERRTIFLSIILGAFIFFAVIGNILVVLSVACHRHLRVVTNYFIMNLAVADLLLSTTVLPFSASLEVSGYWLFGRVFCTVWAAVDVLCCTASILSLCVISVDRYIGVSYPLRYPLIMTKKRGLVTLVGVWALAMVISIGPLLGWKEPDPEDDSVCKITEEPGYALFSALGSFYVPLIVILAMYFRVYLAARKETRSLYSGFKRETLGSADEEVTLRIHRKVSDRNSSCEKRKSLRSAFSFRIHKFSKEKKAAKTLGIVVGVFILCWLPFFVVLPLGSFFPQYKPPEDLFKVIFWLGYFNSCINPIIYPCFSQEFKRAFKRILRGQCRRRRKEREHHFTYRSSVKTAICTLDCEPLKGNFRFRSIPGSNEPRSYSPDDTDWKFSSSLQDLHSLSR
ncbi:alpha-1A adrenergic receptor-like [Erpetoichthys calabaricus]|uniref:alpha-1A adrenergic receptor-like n=1 Tax=Erpetoichthys calabaricus TaxID=27687 RepID=UPI00109F0A8E|nr:alpha-1A adrenergic receptor-like [Erpetoichthys calabaricus]